MGLMTTILVGKRVYLTEKTRASAYQKVVRTETNILFLNDRNLLIFTGDQSHNSLRV
jgi:hypothetical protein